MPQARGGGPEERPGQRPDQAGEPFLPPRRDVDVIEVPAGEVAFAAGREEEHRPEATGGAGEQFPAEVQREPAEAAIDVSEFLEVNDDPRELLRHPPMVVAPRAPRQAGRDVSPRR